MRSDPHRFFVAPGHDDPRLCEVVERADRFWIVEKTIAREITERTDPVGHPILSDLDSASPDLAAQGPKGDRLPADRPR